MKIGKLLNLFRKREKTNQKNNKKVVIFTAFTIFNLFTVSAASFAWFVMAAKSSRLSTVSGDLNVSIKKVVAYKYVFPFYENTTEYINYDGEGAVKGYVVEDSSVTETVSSDTATFTLGKDSNKTIASSAESLSSTCVYPDDAQLFRYYLVGDEAFNGISGKDWHTSSAIPLSSKHDIETDAVEVHNVMVSTGARLILFDEDGINGSNCTYLTYSEAEETNAPFKSVNGNCIECLKAGVYDFRYEKDGDNVKLTVSLQSRDDDSIIGNNIMDPTKISIDWRSLHPEQYEPSAEYMAQGIYDQKTTVILDVTLEYKNVNPVLAQLKVLRSSSASQSIFGIEGRYDNTTDYRAGYYVGGERNPLLASDFCAYYAMLSPQADAFSSADDLWDAMHQKTDAVSEGMPLFSKFENEGESFETSISCSLHPFSGNDEDLIIPGTTTNESNIYHCYIATDYDYEHCSFFLASGRLSKTFLLDRDIGFRFIGTQSLES